MRLDPIRREGGQSDPRQWRWPDAVRTVAALVLLVGGAAIARGDVPAIERSLFLAVNGLPEQLYWPLWVPMQFGSIGGCLVLAVAFGWATRRWAVGLAAVGAVVVAWIVAKVVKAQIGRGRPEDEGVATILHEHLGGGLGFVSGHAALVFALFAVASPHLRRPWQAAALAVAVVVSAARVYMGAHLPLDVISGAGLGLLIGEAFRFVEGRVSRWREPSADERPRTPTLGTTRPG